jgi:ribonuclease P protein component
MKPHGMPRRWRLAERTAIRAVFARGRYHRLGVLHAKTLVSGGAETRYSVSVRKIVGTAPERNRIKRLVREGVRLEPPRLPVPHDVCLFVPAPPAKPPTLADIQRELRLLARRLNDSSGSSVQGSG